MLSNHIVRNFLFGHFSPKTIPVVWSFRVHASSKTATIDADDALEIEPRESVPTPAAPTATVTTASSETTDAPPSFYSLLRNSNFVKLGNLRRSPKPVVGKIVHVVDDDLYIEFGGKFKAVCKRPRTYGRKYRKGTVVTVVLHDLEMTSRFLGAVRDTTLLEADATLLGLAKTFDVDSLASGTAAEEDEEEEQREINLSDTLTYESLENLFVDPNKLESVLSEVYTETSPSEDKQ